MDASVKGSLPVLTDRKGFHANLLSEIYRVMGIAVDHSTVNQPEQAFRTVFLQRCLNFQAGFGYVGEDFSRSLPASVAWTMLNLRYCTMAFTMALNKNTNPKFPPPPGAADMESKNPGRSLDLRTRSQSICQILLLIPYLRSRALPPRSGLLVYDPDCIYV